MKLELSSKRPIFIQIAEQIEEAIFIGSFPEEMQIPSTTDISTAYKINPATVLKGMNLLVDCKIIYKKRGIGMFVCEGAVSRIREKRQECFYDEFIRKLIDEAKKLDIEKKDIISLIERGYEDADRN